MLAEKLGVSAAQQLRLSFPAARTASLSFPACSRLRWELPRGVCPLSLPSPRRGEGITVSFGAEVRRFYGVVGFWVDERRSPKLP